MKSKITNIIYATVIIALAIFIMGTALVKALPFLFPTIGESCREFSTISVHDRTGAVISYSPFSAGTTANGDSHLITDGQGIVASVIGLSAYVCMYVCMYVKPHVLTITLLLTVLATILSIKTPIIASRSSRWIGILLTGALLIYFYLSFVVVVMPSGAGWDTFYVNHDVASYFLFGSTAVRPPGYLIFSYLVTLGQSCPEELKNAALSLLEHNAYSYPVLDLGNPLLNLARVQKIFLLLSCLFFYATLMKFLPKSIPATLLVWLNESGFIDHWYFSSSADSKTLTLATFLLITIVILRLTILGSQKFYLIILLGLLSGYAYLLRPQGIVAFILLGMVLGWLLLTQWKQKRIKYAVIISLMIAVGEASIPSLVTWYGTGVLAPSNVYNELRWTFALQIATEADLQEMPDEITREALKEGLRFKKEREVELAKIYGYPVNLNLALQSNQGISYQVWNILQTKYPNLPNMGRPSGPILDVANVIFKNHYDRFVTEILLPQFHRATEKDISKIATVANFWVVVVLILIFLSFSKANVAICGFSLLVTHLLSMVIMVSFAAPDNGYAFMTEFMLPLALVISLWGLVNRLCQYKHYSRS